MPTFNQGIRTKAGQDLMGRVQSGKTMIHYTKIVFSSLDLSDKTDDEIAQMTDVQPQELIKPQPSVFYKPMTENNDPETEIRAAVDNEILRQGFYINTYALYAADDDNNEILFGVTCDDHPSWLPAYDGVRPQALTYNWDIGNKNGTGNVKFTDAHDEYATYGDLEDFSNAVNTRLSGVADNTDLVSDFDKFKKKSTHLIAYNTEDLGNTKLNLSNVSETASANASNISDLSSENSDLATDYDSFTSNFNGTTDTILAAVNDTASGKTPFLTSLSASVSTNSEAISNIQANGTNASSLADINTTASSALNQANTTNTDLNSFISNYNANDKATGDLINKIEKLLQGQITDIKNNSLSSISGSLSANTSSISSNSSGITSLRTDLDNTKDTMATIGDNTTGNKIDVSSLKAQVTSLSSKVAALSNSGSSVKDVKTITDFNNMPDGNYLGSLNSNVIHIPQYYNSNAQMMSSVSGDLIYLSQYSVGSYKFQILFDHPRGTCLCRLNMGSNWDSWRQV